jgi:hypothetical protein
MGIVVLDVIDTPVRLVAIKELPVGGVALIAYVAGKSQSVASPLALVLRDDPEG